MNNFDLHMHSFYSSDGQYSPSELIDMAQKKKLKTIALTDHDSVRGVKEMVSLGKQEGIHVIPGIECSTRIDDTEVHLLGYGMDLNNDYFLGLESKVRSLSAAAFHERVVKLENKYSIHIDEEKILKEANGENPWFLMCTNIFNNPAYQDIPDFKDYIPGGKRSDPAPVNFFWDKCQAGSNLYVFVDYPDFTDTVKKIHEAGGVAIVAHPFNTFYKNERNLKVLLDSGVDGIEAYSNYHSSIQNEYYEKFAIENHLLISCGSDFHGSKKPSIEMGEYGLKKDGSIWLDALLKRLSV